MFKYLIGLLILPLAFSCSDDVCIEDSPNLKTSRSTERVIDVSGVETYYYYDHKRVYVQLDTTKEHIILHDKSEASRSTYSNLYRTEKYRYTGRIVSSTEESNVLLANDKLEVATIEDVTIDGTPLSPFIYVGLKSTSDVTLLKKLASQINWTI